jgi:hypothetical protein
MSSRNPLVFNFLLVLVVGLLVLLFTDWNALAGMILCALLALVANAFMCVKALWNRDYRFALSYFVIALLEIPLCIFLGGPTRIGH